MRDDVLDDRSELPRVRRIPVPTAAPPAQPSPAAPAAPTAPVPSAVEAPARESLSRRLGRALPAADWAAWRGDLVAVLVLAVLALMLTWPLPRHLTTRVPDLGDPLDSAWRLSWPVHQLLRDPRHLFDANIFHPFETTYLFDELILGIALLVAPVTLLSGNGILAFNVALIGAFAANGVAMYALGRRLTGSRAAALVGALVFMAAPFRFQHIGHLGLSSAYWIPLALLFLDRLLARPSWRDAILFGGCVAVQSLSAQYYGFQIAIVIGLYLLYVALRRPGLVFRGPFILRLIVATVFAEALLLPVVAPYAAVKGTWGYSRGLVEHELNSATLSSFLAAPAANPVAGRLTAALREATGLQRWNIWLYPGLGALLMALLGLARPVRVATRHHAGPIPDSMSWGQAPPATADPDDADAGPSDLYPFMVLLALFAAVMALGPTLYPQAIGEGAVTRTMPYRFFFAAVPLLDATRAPERYGNLLLLGLAGAVAYGAAAVLAAADDLPRRLRRAVRPLLALLLLAVVGAEYWRTPLRAPTVPPTPPVYAWLAKQPPGVAVELPIGAPVEEPNREQLRLYWSTKHWQRRINGSSDLVPYAQVGLRRELVSFPNPRTLGILQGLGVRYVVVHRAQLRPGDWERLAPVYESYGATLQPRGEFSDALAFELQPDERFATLRRTIGRDADIFLSSGDILATDVYMAMLGYLLRDNQLVTRIEPTFGPRYRRPEAGKPAAYAVLYRHEDPARYNYPAGQVVYEDNVVRVYQRR